MARKAKTAAKRTKATGSSPSKLLYCSFCLKSQTQVKKLIAGPSSIFICDECVALCNEIIADRTPDVSKSLPVDKLPTERLLIRLQPIEATRQSKGSELQRVVDILRSRKISWAHIGEALGISRQSAWERFS